MKTSGKIVSFAALALISIGILIFMKNGKNDLSSEGYVGKSTITVDDGKMSPEVLLAFGRLSDPQVSPDGEHILYAVSYTSVADNKSVRNLWICNIDGSDPQQITTSGKSLNNARWSEDGKKIAFTMGGQIWTARISEKGGNWKIGGLRQVSDIPGGIGEFKLSPDQKKVMYISYVKSGVKSPADIYPELDKATAYTTDDLLYRHWDHTVMEIPHTYVADFSFSGSKNITVENSVDVLGEDGALYELPTEPFSGLEQLDWSPDSRFIAYSCRKLTGKKYAFSTNTEIYLYNIKTGETSVIDMKGGYDTDPVWSPDGSKIAWISMARDGYEADKQRLMVASVDWAGVSKNGKGLPSVSEIQDITETFRYNVSGPSWAAGSDAVYFASLAEGIQGMFAAKEKNGTWEIERLTGDDLWYDFGSPFHVVDNQDGSKTFYTTWCSMDFPTELVAVTGMVCRKITHENDHILSQLTPHKTEARMIKTVDGKDMLTWVLYPPQFDESKVYHSILICLGGPQGTLSQGWSYRWNYRLMADQGYVVVLPNRRGTTAFGQ